MTAKVLVVTSGKGGVGKTTSTAALGAALAQAGQNVVVVDFDVGLRNLDLILGAERRVVYDIVNVINGDAKLGQALIRDKRVDKLSLLPASQTRDKDALTSEGVAKVIAELREKFDWVDLRQPRRHREGGDARDVPCRHRGGRDQPGSVLGTRLRPHHRHAGFEDRPRRERRARGKTSAADPLRHRARQPRRDAEWVEDVLEILSIPAARHHPGKRGGAARLQCRLAGHAQQSVEARRRGPMPMRQNACAARPSR